MFNVRKWLILSKKPELQNGCLRILHDFSSYYLYVRYPYNTYTLFSLNLTGNTRRAPRWLSSFRILRETVTWPKSPTRVDNSFVFPRDTYVSRRINVLHCTVGDEFVGTKARRRNAWCRSTKYYYFRSNGIRFVRTSAKTVYHTGVT